MKPEAIIFDMDGVLLESEEYINRAGVLLFKEKGHNVDPGDFIQFTGMGEDRYLGGVAEIYGIPFDPEDDKARTYEIYKSLVKGKLKPLPGVIEFIEKCKDHDIKMAVATSADRIKMEINLKEIELPLNTFDATVNGQEIERKKPAPDIFLMAAERLGVNIERCVVIEDAVSGVAAGKKAGARVLALTTTFSAKDLAGADWIAQDLRNTPEEVLYW